MELFENFDTVIEVGAYILSVVMTFLTSYFHSSKKMHQMASHAINEAEKAFEGTSKKGQNKFDYALMTLHSHVPAVLRPFITKEMLSKILQSAFDEISAFATQKLDATVERAEDILYGSEEERG